VCVFVVYMEDVSNNKETVVILRNFLARGTKSPLLMFEDSTEISFLKVRKVKFSPLQALEALRVVRG
jgi:hypothetical protein